MDSSDSPSSFTVNAKRRDITASKSRGGAGGETKWEPSQVESIAKVVKRRKFFGPTRSFEPSSRLSLTSLKRKGKQKEGTDEAEAYLTTKKL